MANKDFRTIGDCGSLWGKHLWGSGKKLVITEGEIDAMSLAEVQHCKWPVVSLPNGAGSAKKVFKRDLEWLLKFDEIILMFDQDPAGQEAAKEAAELLPPGRVKIAALSEKDPNAMLVAGKGPELVSAVWSASTFRPDGIVAGEDTWELITTKVNPSLYGYPWDGLTLKTLGLRKGEIVTFCAGTGAGKSTAVKEIASYLLDKGETVGYLAFEESVSQTAMDFMSIKADKMLHLENNLDEKYLRDIWSSVFSGGRIYLYDHWGGLDVDVLLNRIRYLSHSCNVEWIVLDHISIMVSGVAEGDERRLIDNLMTKLRSLVEELNIGMLVVSHLKQGEKGSHEEGAKVSLSQLRGSRAIGQLSDFVIALERDQQEDNGTTTVKVLKARYKGSSTGFACKLFYDNQTGRLSECGSERIQSQMLEGGF